MRRLGAPALLSLLLHTVPASLVLPPTEASGPVPTGPALFSALGMWGAASPPTGARIQLGVLTSICLKHPRGITHFRMLHSNSPTPFLKSLCGQKFSGGSLRDSVQREARTAGTRPRDWCIQGCRILHTDKKQGGEEQAKAPTTACKSAAELRSLPAHAEGQGRQGRAPPLEALGKGQGALSRACAIGWVGWPPCPTREAQAKTTLHAPNCSSSNYPSPRPLSLALQRHDPLDRTGELHLPPDTDLLGLSLSVNRTPSPSAYDDHPSSGEHKLQGYPALCRYYRCCLIAALAGITACGSRAPPRASANRSASWPLSARVVSWNPSSRSCPCPGCLCLLSMTFPR